MENPKLSEIIFALEQVKELNGDKEVNQLTLNYNENEIELFVDFTDYESHTIEVKNNS